MHLPNIEWHEPVVGSGEEGFFADAEQRFQVMPLELVKSYNKMAITLELLHGFWAQVIEAAWEADGDMEMFRQILGRAQQQQQ